MFYHLFTYFMNWVGPFRVFRYASFRIPAATLTSLVLTLWLFPRFIDLLRERQGGNTRVREDTPDTHRKKHGTPTMGGLFILMTVALSSWLWTDLTNVYVWATLMVLLGFGAIGFADDYLKISKKNSKGLSGRRKIAWQLVVLSGVAGILALAQQGLIPDAQVALDTRLSLPFVANKWFNPELGALYVPFALLVVVGTSHAVNLTDGLDGLAIGPTIVSSIAFLVLAYAAGLVIKFNVAGC